MTKENSNITDAKPWYQSATILGSLTTGIVALLGIFKINLIDSQPEITNALLALGTLIGTAITIAGRIRAKTTITK